MFLKRSGDEIIILIVYVNDIVIAGNGNIEICCLKTYLRSELNIEDLPVLKETENLVCQI